MDTSIREKILSFADILMRVPPLFIIDELLRISLGLPGEDIIIDNIENDFKTTNASSIFSIATYSFLIEQFGFIYIAYKTYLLITFKFLCCCIGKYIRRDNYVILINLMLLHVRLMRINYMFYIRLFFYAVELMSN